MNTIATQGMPWSVYCAVLNAVGNNSRAKCVAVPLLVYTILSIKLLSCAVVLIDPNDKNNWSLTFESNNSDMSFAISNFKVRNDIGFIPHKSFHCN